MEITDSSGPCSEPESTATRRLVHNAQEGNGEALNQLCDRYYRRVRYVVRRRLGRGLRRKTDSEEILQDTFHYAIDHFDSFEMRSRSSLLNWLSRIAESKIREAFHYYGARKRAWVHPHEPEDSIAEVACGEPQPLQTLILQDETQRLQTCLGQLSSHYRQLIVLRDFAGKCFAEIAAATGRPSADAARMMYKVAVRELRHLLSR